MSKRMRKRYIALNLESEQPVNKRDCMDAVWKAVLRLLGEYGASQTNLSLIEYDPQRSYAATRTSVKTPLWTF